jgi:hypothetical protein
VDVPVAVAVACGDATGREMPVGVAVGWGGFNKLGAINKNAPNATKLARIQSRVVRLGSRGDQFISKHQYPGFHSFAVLLSFAVGFRPTRANCHTLQGTRELVRVLHQLAAHSVCPEGNRNAHYAFP